MIPKRGEKSIYFAARPIGPRVVADKVAVKLAYIVVDRGRTVGIVPGRDNEIDIQTVDEIPDGSGVNTGIVIADGGKADLVDVVDRNDEGFAVPGYRLNKDLRS